MILQVNYNSSTRILGTEPSPHSQSLTDRMIINSIFQPDDNPVDTDLGQNRSGLVPEDSTRINMEIQFAHFVLINLLIVLPPFLHVLGECRASRSDVCSKFIISVTSGCFFSFLIGTKALTLTFLSGSEGGIMNLCLSYITVDNIVLAWLILSASLYNVKASRTSPWQHNTTKLFLWVWFVVVVVIQLVTLVTTNGRAQCVSSPVRVSDSVSIYMPMVRCEQSSTSLTVISAVIYLPPVFSILTSGLRMRHQKGISSVTKTPSSDVITSIHRKCMVCARTLSLFNLWWWRSFLCLLLGIARPCWILGNWFLYSEYTDFPPVVGIVLVFYPMCVAQTINVFRCMYSSEQSRVFHV